jgi:hypothetical protein
MTDTTTPSPFTIDTLIAQQHPEHTDLDTATLWTLHLEIPSGVDPLAAAKAVLSTGAEVLTGEYCGGDSFLEWCESMDDDRFPDSQAYRASRGRALHLHFRAPDVYNARVIADTILRFTVRRHPDTYDSWLQPEHAGITTAGDWAEYAEIWPFGTAMDKVLDEFAEFEKQWNL